MSEEQGQQLAGTAAARNAGSVGRLAVSDSLDDRHSVLAGLAYVS